MKRSVLFLLSLVLICSNAFGQKKVLLESFTGARSANCPMGAYYADSMTVAHPNVIAVNLHSYFMQDSMYFNAEDTLAQAYAVGVPMGAVDRINHPSGVAVGYAQWDSNIQQRLIDTPRVDVTMSSVWDSASRDITTHVQVSILSNLDSGDYRMSLYVVEDSVTGIGSGYDQANGYNATVGNPFFGKGNPIVGFIHRHVVRALLPSAWGLAGVFTVTPTTGQNYAHIFHYTLPANYNENKISLVAFVSAYTADHLGDSVLNAAQEKLVVHPVVAGITGSRQNSFSIYPNPSNGEMTFSSGNSKQYTLCLYNTLGQMVFKKYFVGATNVAKAFLGHSGLYYAKIMQGSEQVAVITVTFSD